MIQPLLKYRFLIGTAGKNREVFVRGISPVNAEYRLKKTLEQDNKKNNRNTEIIEFVGICTD